MAQSLTLWVARAGPDRDSLSDQSNLGSLEIKIRVVLYYCAVERVAKEILLIDVEITP